MTDTMSFGEDSSLGMGHEMMRNKFVASADSHLP
jgi:hypothetical protein